MGGKLGGKLEGKVVLVTGGGSGLGRAAGLVFAREGTKVVVSDVDVQGGEQTVRLIQKSGGEAVFVKCDVTKGVEVEAMVNKAVETYSKLDCAFNNAGILILPPTSFTDYSEEDWDHVINVNLKGVMLCMKYEIRQMLKQGSGAIVNTSSLGGLVVGHPGFGAYVASKFGLIGLTRTAAIEYAKAGIRVNVVCPAFMRTPMWERLMGLDPGIEASAIKTCPMGRTSDPAETAEAVLFLFSDAASYVTGCAMPLDGGIFAQLLKINEDIAEQVMSS
jgi:NAD(P)-dependent dehydrogenase (short-subunit alcohol dehydrogenase family)